MPCKYYYSLVELDDLEEAAESAHPSQQEQALQIVADIFNPIGLPYGVMGGFNFYLRGSGRTTDDVDLAVSSAQSLETTLELLNHDDRITRPREKMIWVGGVARIFVLVRNASDQPPPEMGGQNHGQEQGQQVQIDLKWQRTEGHGMPSDLSLATELLPIPSTGGKVRFLKIGPLVRAKFQSYGRGKEGDYSDLLFVCKDARYSGIVREEAAEHVNPEKRRAFLEEVLERNPDQEKAVRYALRIPPDE